MRWEYRSPFTPACLGGPTATDARRPAWLCAAFGPGVVSLRPAHASSVAVALAAPHDHNELEEDLAVLEAAEPLAPAEYKALAAHGQRMQGRHAGRFP